MPPDDLLTPVNPDNPSDAPASYRYEIEDDTGKIRRLDRFDPLTYFEVNVEDKRRMHDVRLRTKERQMPIADVSHPCHLAIFGRSLWSAYTDVKVLLAVARAKLLGGEGTYDSSNVNQVFAVCSNRLSLDPCLQISESLPLAYEAVRCHMRIVKSLDVAAGTLVTVAISEPILAIAAMDLLNAAAETWQESISTLASRLFRTSLVDKGRKGELFSRLVVVLAADDVRLNSTFDEPSPERVAIPTFTVKQFLIALYGSQREDLINLIPAVLLQSVMNFTHFVRTSRILPAHEMWKQCQDLLRRTAALQLAPNQADIDLFIPIYMGDQYKPFDARKSHWIGVQTKNRQDATTLLGYLRECMNE